MTKKCKFEVDVTYNSEYFAEGEIRETIRKAIVDLNAQKEKNFGRLKLSDKGKTTHGMTCNVNKAVVYENKIPQVFAEEIAELNSLMDEEIIDPKMILPDAHIEELINEVKTAYGK